MDHSSLYSNFNNLLAFGKEGLKRSTRGLFNGGILKPCGLAKDSTNLKKTQQSGLNQYVSKKNQKPSCENWTGFLILYRCMTYVVWLGARYNCVSFSHLKIDITSLKETFRPKAREPKTHFTSLEPVRLSHFTLA